jgi:hypothetical protein
LAPEALAGIYQHPGFGRVIVSADGKPLPSIYSATIAAWRIGTAISMAPFPRTR